MLSVGEDATERLCEVNRQLHDLAPRRVLRTVARLLACVCVCVCVYCAHMYVFVFVCVRVCLCTFVGELLCVC